jgi:hypothetical protein
MRLIFMVLLMGNVAFFISQLLVSETETVHSSGVAERQINKLQTLAERNAKGKMPDKVTQKITDAVGSSLAGGSSDQCQLIGPFAELLHAEYLVERLAGLEVEAVIKNIEIADGKNYWVYLKPEMSEKEALRKLYEVQAKSIDSYIIPSGELANGISFGQFADIKEATEKVEKIRSQGYAAEIKEIPKSHTEVWVEIKDKSEQKISADQWLELLKEENGIERRQNYCLGVAR